MNSIELISVIIPVYNTEIGLLHRCIESIVNSTYKNFEIIIIDDGSDSMYADELNQLIKKNVIVVHNQHAGVSAARNTGLKVAKGEFVSFIDGDDTIPVNYFDEAIDLITRYNLDIAVGGIQYIDASNGNILADKHYILKKDQSVEIFYEKRDKNLVIANVLVDNLQERGFSNCVSGSACGKLYRKKILQNSSFDEELFLSEDRMFNLDVFSIAERIGFTDSIWYFYYQYNHSAIHSYHKDSIKNMSKLFEHCLYRIQVNSGIESYISKWMMSNIYICIFLDLLHKDNRRGFMFNKNRLLKWFYSEEWKKSKEYFTYKDLPIHTKIAAYLCVHDQALLMLVYWIICDAIRITFRKIK